MTNEEKYINAFTEAFELEVEDAKKARYGQTTNWDSVGHMELIAALEDAFAVMLDMDDVIALNSFDKGKELLRKYEVEI